MDPWKNDYEARLAALPAHLNLDRPGSGEITLRELVWAASLARAYRCRQDADRLEARILRRCERG